MFKVLDNLAHSSIIVVSLEGGEPFLRKDIQEILEYTDNLPFYTEITTSGENIEKCYIEEYQNMDFLLHISIDESHGNLDLYKQLKELKKYHSPLAVQIVVRKNDLDKLEEKVKYAYEAQTKVVIMPAVHLDGTEDLYPDPYEFRKLLHLLKSKYPNIIISPDRFLDMINMAHGCNTSSIMIDCDGMLYYPCRILKQKTINLVNQSLMEFLDSDMAKDCRKTMRACNRKCGWYQYFASPTFSSLSSFIHFIKMYYSDHREIFGIKSKIRRYLWHRNVL